MNLAARINSNSEKKIRLLNDWNHLSLISLHNDSLRKYFLAAVIYRDNIYYARDSSFSLYLQRYSNYCVGSLSHSV